MIPNADGLLPDGYIGGCMITDESPRWHCMACGHLWGPNTPDRRYTVHARADGDEFIAFVTGGLPANTHAATQADSFDLLARNVREAIEAATGEDDFAVDWVLGEDALAGLISNGGFGRPQG